MKDIKIAKVIIFCILFQFFIHKVKANNNELKEMSRNLIKELGFNLKQSLQAVLAESGPISALEYCNIAALNITQQIKENSNLSIKRTSLKIRNSDNVPDLWEFRVLNNFAERHALGENVDSMNFYEIYADDQGKNIFRYMVPISTNEVCLTCHGENIEPELRGKIQYLYPEDKAIDYSLGNIRGAFSVKIYLD